MAAADGFKNWQTCWEVNVLFHTDFRVSQPYKCIWCKRDQEGTEHMRSDFGLVAAQCSAKHQPLIGEKFAGVCAECDVDLVQKISEKRQLCFQEDCKRFMLVDENAVKRRLAGIDAKLMEKYLELIKKYRFFNCPVCTFDIPLDEGPPRPPTGLCQHDPTYCSDCLADYIKNKVQNHEWHDIKCPETGCKASLRGRDIAEFADTETVKIYDEHITMANLSKNPNFRWCHTKCGNGQIITIKSSSEPNWRCGKCGSLNCFNCKDGHAGETCAEYKRQNSRTKNTELELRKISKRCPKRGCGRYIHKIKGCAHMICEESIGGCGTRFCWKCKIIFKEKPGTASQYYTSYLYRHVATCRMVGGRYEDFGVVPRPSWGDPLYREGWDNDPDYEAGDSGTESYMR